MMVSVTEMDEPCAAFKETRAWRQQQPWLTAGSSDKYENKGNYCVAHHWDLALQKKKKEKQNRWQPQTTIERRRLIDPFEQCKHRQHSPSANTEAASEKTSPRAEECRLAQLNSERPFCGPTRLSSASSSSEFLCQHNKTPGDRRETNQDLGP